MIDQQTALSRVGLFSALPSDMVAELSNSLELIECGPGETLAKLGAMGSFVWIVAQGEVQIVAAAMHGEQVTGLVTANGIVDESLLLMGGTHTATFRTTCACVLFKLDVSVFSSFVRQDNSAWSQLATSRMLTTALASVVSNVFGAAADVVMALAASEDRWKRLDKGDVLIHQGAAAQDWYVVLSGEVVALQGSKTDAKVVGCMHRGDTVGELPHIVKGLHSSHLVASRDSWLIRFNSAEFSSLFFERADAQQGVLRTLVKQLSGKHLETTHVAGMRIAVLPTQGVNVTSFVDQLEQALSRFGPVFVLDGIFCEALHIVHEPDSLPADHVEWLRLSAWLEKQGNAGVRTIMMGDTSSLGWQERIYHEADLVLYVGDGANRASASSGIYPPTRTKAPAARHEKWWHSPEWLCLVHSRDTVRPQGTSIWLDNSQVDAHFHVRVQHEGDFSRLARHISGNAIGLALSGGGARGPAHAGAYRALTEAGIPVDFVSGTSAGSLMASLVAGDTTSDVVAMRASQGIGGTKGLFADYTLPVVALLRSQRLRNAVHQTFGNEMLEDSWIPCAIVTTNLTKACREVFTRGVIWRIALASCSPPAVTMPVVIGDELYCDGGLVDNLPVDLLVDKGCRFTIASYIGTKQNLRLNGQEFPNAWSIAFDRLFRGGKKTKGIPHLAELLVAATTLASDAAMPRIEQAVNVFLRPDLEDFSVLNFSKTAEVIDAGYQQTVKTLVQNRQMQNSKSQDLWAIVEQLALPTAQAAEKALADWAKYRA